MRFDELIRGTMTAREIRRRYPETLPVLENFGFREVCYDCSLEVLARRQEMDPVKVVDALNQAVWRARRDAPES